MIRHPKDKAESKHSVDLASTREDEDRFHKLMHENEELLRLIAVVSSLNSFKMITFYLSNSFVFLFFH